MPIHHFPKETVIFKNAPISILTTRVSKSEANLLSDAKVDFSRNLENE